jgi:hypothetical protein
VLPSTQPASNDPPPSNDINPPASDFLYSNPMRQTIHSTPALHRLIVVFP